MLSFSLFVKQERQYRETEIPETSLKIGNSQNDTGEKLNGC